MKQHTEHDHRHTKSTLSSFIASRRLKGIPKNSCSFFAFFFPSFDILHTWVTLCIIIIIIIENTLNFFLFIGFTSVVEINKIFYFVCNSFHSTFRYSNFDLSKSKISTLIHRMTEDWIFLWLHKISPVSQLDYDSLLQNPISDRNRIIFFRVFTFRFLFQLWTLKIANSQFGNHDKYNRNSKWIRDDFFSLPTYLSQDLETKFEHG